MLLLSFQQKKNIHLYQQKKKIIYISGLKSSYYLCKMKLKLIYKIKLRICEKLVNILNSGLIATKTKLPIIAKLEFPLEND